MQITSRYQDEDESAIIHFTITYDVRDGYAATLFEPGEGPSVENVTFRATRVDFLGDDGQTEDSVDLDAVSTARPYWSGLLQRHYGRSVRFQDEIERACLAEVE
jgi:hypothetical protein